MSVETRKSLILHLEDDGWLAHEEMTEKDLAALADAILASDWLAEHEERVRVEAREVAELSWQAQVKKYADLVESYRESIERVHTDANSRIKRARIAAAEAWDEGYSAGDPYQRRGNPETVVNPYRAALSQATP